MNNSNYVYGLYIMSGCAVLIFTAFLYQFYQSMAFHKVLDDFKTRAMLTGDEQALRYIKESVIRYRDTHCFHCNLRHHADEVISYINVRIYEVVECEILKNIEERGE